MNEKARLNSARLITLVWGGVFILFAGLFQDQQNPVVELGLAIATFTYGGLLGVFLLGFINKTVNDKGASISLVLTIATMTLVILGVKYAETKGWFFTLNNSDNSDVIQQAKSIAWPLYTLFGALLTIGFGRTLSFFEIFRVSQLRAVE